MCRSQRQMMHSWWQHGLLAAPPPIQTAMLAAMDGDANAVHGALAKLPARQAQRWREVALGLAVLGGQTATAVRLLDAGADPNARPLSPALKPQPYKHVVGAMAHDPRLGGAKGVKVLKAAGLVRKNAPHPGAAPIFTAITCHNLAAVNALLRHHADPMLRPYHDGADPLNYAVFDGDVPIIRTLLAHGANACAEDRNMVEGAKRRHRPGLPLTIAGQARKAGLPASLVKRLVCRAAARPLTRMLDRVSEANRDLDRLNMAIGRTAYGR